MLYFIGQLLFQMIVTAVWVSLSSPGPFLVQATWRCENQNFQESVILVHAWLLVLTLGNLVMALACLKYCATNKDAR